MCTEKYFILGVLALLSSRLTKTSSKILKSAGEKEHSFKRILLGLALTHSTLVLSLEREPR